MITAYRARLRRPALALLLVLSLVTPVLAATPAQATDDVSLPALWASTITGSDLRTVRTISRNSAYTRYAITYRSGSLRISGVMNVPTGTGPFPVVILAHGYIDPEIYVTGQGLAREQDYLARRGFVALHTDYRNHATSSKDPQNNVRLRLGYTEDVISAALAVQNSRLAYLDGDRIALLGRSMGGGVTYNALVTRPGLFDAAVVYASVSARAGENFNKWQRNNYDIAREIGQRYGMPEDNRRFWNQVSPITFFDRITEPVLVHHGTADSTCPIRWADAAVRKMRAAGVDVTYKTYRGAGHTFYDVWDDSMRTTVTFLNRHLD